MISGTARKRLSMVLLMLLLPLWVHAVPKPARAEVDYKNANFHPSMKVLNLRGGDLGPIKGKTLATTFSVLAGSDAICGALIPRTSMRCQAGN